MPCENEWPSENMRDIVSRIVDLETQKLEIVKDLMVDIYKNPQKYAGVIKYSEVLDDSGKIRSK